MNIQEAAKRHVESIIKTANPSPNWVEEVFIAGAIWQEQQGWVRTKQTHRGIHFDESPIWKCYAILMAEFIAEMNYEYRYSDDSFTEWNEVEDPKLHAQGGPYILTTHQLYLEFEKWLSKREISKYITPPGSTPIESKEGKYREGIEAFLKWMQENRPHVSGLGAPIMMLKELLKD